MSLVDSVLLLNLKNWALHILEEENKQEFKYRSGKHKQLSRLVADYEVELYDLNKTFTRGKLDEDFYTSEKADLKLKIARAKTNLIIAMWLQINGLN